jgi:CBS domain-containing protein
MTTAVQRRLPMRIMDIMSTDVVTVRPTTSLKDVARLLVEHNISGVPVVDDDGAVVGVVSEGDLLFKERGRVERGRILSWLLDEYGTNGQAKEQAVTAADAMTSPACTIAPSRPVSAAAAMMLEEHVHRLPVVARDRLVGIVTRHDLVRAFVRSDDAIEDEIREVMHRLLLPDMGAGVNVKVREGGVVLTGRLERRSDVEIVNRLTERVPGVVSVSSDVTWRDDDGSGV